MNIKIILICILIRLHIRSMFDPLRCRPPSSSSSANRFAWIRWNWILSSVLSLQAAFNLFRCFGFFLLLTSRVSIAKSFSFLFARTISIENHSNPKNEHFFDVNTGAKNTKSILFCSDCGWRATENECYVALDSQWLCDVMSVFSAPIDRTTEMNTANTPAINFMLHVQMFPSVPFAQSFIIFCDTKSIAMKPKCNAENLTLSLYLNKQVKTSDFQITLKFKSRI